MSIESGCSRKTQSINPIKDWRTEQFIKMNVTKIKRFREHQDMNAFARYVDMVPLFPEDGTLSSCT